MTTTTTDLALIPDAEVAGPLDKRQAKALDKKVRATSDRVSKGFTALDNTIETLGELIQQAMDGEIHKGLGLKSWTAWVKDAVQVTVPDRFQRKELVRELSKTGMSQRAIGAVFGVSQKTIDRDLDGEQVADDATVTSLDGAERPKGGKAKDDNVIDAEVVEEEADEPMKAVDIVTEFNDEVANLWGAQAALTDLVAEEKWAGARKRVYKANLNHVQQVITALVAIVDDLMSED